MYGGFWVRLAAFLIDVIVVGLLTLMFLGPIEFAAALAGSDNFFTKPLLFRFNFFDILEYLILTAYFVLMTYFCGTTLGKRLLNLKVVSADGEPLKLWNVLYRETIGRYLSSLLCIGYVLVGVDKEKRGLHDMLCDTRVEYQCKLPTVRQVIQTAPAVPHSVPYPQQGQSRSVQQTYNPPTAPLNPAGQQLPPQENLPPRQ